jgi:hypothetical protein
MPKRALFPLHEDTAWLLRHAKLPPHAGVGVVESHGEIDHPVIKQLSQFTKQINDSTSSPEEFHVTCLVPASGHCLLILKSIGRNPLTRNFGKGLSVGGESSAGPFKLNCPMYYVNAVSGPFEEPGWAIASPVNVPLTIFYGAPRPAARIVAVVNNFDFEDGNVQARGPRSSRREILRVTAAEASVDFVWRDDRTQVRRLLDAGILRTASLTTLSFEAWPEAREEDLIDFARDVASLCGIVTKQHTGLPIISLLDAEGAPIKRIVANPVESDFRRDSILQVLHFDRNGLPQVFRQCFAEYVTLRKSPLWNRISSYIAGIEDSSYLEQRVATLMPAIELLLRSSLVEAGVCSTGTAERAVLPDLLGMARRSLAWDIPRHYTVRDSYRILRNAVVHGLRLPSGAENTRREFDKWHLFLLRRVLMRLGYDGYVQCPHRGFVSSSPVNDFSAEFNSFNLTD